jgi:4-hydroxyisophthalate hydroxylase
MPEKFQIVIVGGGPVGVGLAVELGQRGISCALVERHLEPQRIPKGQNLTQRTLEHFYFWHCVDELRAARIMPAEVPTSGVNVYRDLMSDYWNAPSQRELVQQYYFQAYDRLPQYCAEAVLRARMAALPTVKTFFGWRAEKIEQDIQSARVAIVVIAQRWRPNTWSAATAAIRWCAIRPASSAAVLSTIRKWC